MRANLEVVRAFVLACVRDPGVAEAVLRATFGDARRELDHLDPRSPAGPWLRGLAARRLLGLRGSVDRAGVYHCDRPMLARIEESFALLDRVEGSDGRQQMARVIAATDALSEQQRSALVMHYDRGASCATIGAHLGLGEDAARLVVQAARTALARALRRQLVPTARREVRR